MTKRNKNDLPCPQRTDPTRTPHPLERELIPILLSGSAECGFKRLTIITLFIALLLPTGSSATLTQDGDGIIITPENADQVVELLVLKDHKGYVNSVVFAPDGQSVLFAPHDTLLFSDVQTGNTLHTFELHAAYDYFVVYFAFTPDGQTILAGTNNGTLRRWDVTTGDLLHILKRDMRLIESMVFAPDGQTVLFSLFSDHILRLWDVTTGETLQTFEGHEHGVTSLAFAPDGQTVFSGSSDNTLRLWDVATGEMVRVFQGHTGDVRSIAVAPDGQTVLTGSWDNTLRLWDIAPDSPTFGETLQVFEGHTGFVMSVAFAPDGQTVLSGSLDHTLRLWDAETGAAVQVFEEHTDEVSSVAFSPDGTRLASGGSTGTVRIWGIPSE
jgi:WD40 repeat protein